MARQLFFAAVLLHVITFATSSYPVVGIKRDIRGYEVLAPQSSSHGGDKPSFEEISLPVGTCNSNTPCENGACCGSNNLCGYSKKECGTGCQSNCNAKAECGPYALPENAKCPLNVCCSKFGFCGSTREFCSWTNPDDPDYPACDTKWGGCGDVKRPSCGGGSSVSKRTIGYYETWSNNRKKSPVSPEDLNLDGFTHINFAFSFFDASSFEITSMDSNAATLYQRFTKLKEKKNGLQAWISVGGWSFTDPGSTQKAFSNMVSTQENRAKFIKILKRFIDTYGFDGIDIDWEYPGADDRGGVKADTANYVSFVQDLRSAFGGQYGISMTIPTSYWYLQHFDLSGIQQHIDWFNLMAYDLHGVWDKDSKFIGPYIAPHTNITEIDLSLDLLWRAGVKPEKVILGQGWYGRSFTLTDPSCNVPGVCQFSDGGKAGPISNAAGILIYEEILDIIKKNSLKPTWDKTAGVKWITWDKDQWVSYDDVDTFQQKRNFGNSRCMGGLMVWAMDQVDQSASNGLSPDGTVTKDNQDNAQQMSADLHAKLTCRTTDCGESCPKGTHKVTETNGQPGQLSTSARCPKGKYRSVCCDDGTTMGKCEWRGYRGAGLSCISGCAEGDTEVATANNNHDKKKGDQNCNGGLQSYCCTGFKPAPSKEELKRKAQDAAKAAAEAAAEQAALDIAANAFCRVAVPALLAPLELAESLIPFIGEILDAAELLATPALIRACVKGIEKEGKAEFKVFGKKHSLTWDKPTTKPSKTRPPSSSHSPPKTSTRDSCTAKRGVGLEKRVCDQRMTRTDYTASTTVYQTTTKHCIGGRWPQACWHYSSVIKYNPRFNPVTCSSFAPHRNFVQGGPATKQWRKEHDKAWDNWMRIKPAACDRDEWPPQHFWQGDPGQLIRYNPLVDNRGAGNLWKEFCPEQADTRCERGSEHLIDDPKKRYATLQCRKQVTIKVMHMDFDMDDLPLIQVRDEGLSANPCYPQELVNDPTYAILNGDSYFKRNGRNFDPQFAQPPSDALINGRSPPYPNMKNAVVYLPNGEIAVDTGNTTRPLSSDEVDLVSRELELGEQLELIDEQWIEGDVDCNGYSYATQVVPVRQSSMMPQPPMIAPVINSARATARVASQMEHVDGAAVPSSRSRSGLSSPAMMTTTATAI